MNIELLKVRRAKSFYNLTKHLILVNELHTSTLNRTSLTEYYVRVAERVAKSLYFTVLDLALRINIQQM